MAAYKVINLDSPIESDYWVDIPVRDPATNKDAVDEEGRILVERHVTRSVKNEELSTINTAVETVNTLKEEYSTFKEEVSTKVNNHDSTILTNTNNITNLTDSVNNHDLQINALYTKINAIQGIDIDDFKYVTETDIKNIKENYLPLAGGTVTGDVVFSGSVGSNSPIKADLQGTADRAIGDINDKALTSYIANIEVSGASVTVTNGAGETSNYTVDNINHASHADSATSATSATSAISAISAVNATHADSATSATSATHADSATSAKHATSADSASNTNNLGGYPAFNYVRSVNGINTDRNGNVQLGNFGVITGKIEWFAFNTAPKGYLVCDGSQVSRTTYADLFKAIGTTFGKGNGSTTFNLPNLIDKFAQGSTTVGTYKSAGLPNITGSLTNRGTGFRSTQASSNGCIVVGGDLSNSIAAVSATSNNVSIDASRSNSIYGNSSTVQPPALTLLPCIKY